MYVVDHVKVGVVDGPSEAVVKQVQVFDMYSRCLRRRRKDTLNMQTRRQLQERHFSTRSQRGLNSNISKIGAANHIDCSTLPSP